MYYSNLRAEDTYGNMYVVAMVLGMLETLAVEQEFSKRLHELTMQAWNLFPRQFVVEFPEE